MADGSGRRRRTDGGDIPTPSIVTFKRATDEEIAKMLEAHYAGTINIEDYWSVGDERVVHLDAMSAGTGANESHVAQDMTMVIIGFNQDELETPIGIRTKSAMTVQCRETLGDNNGKAEAGFYWGSVLETDVNTNYPQNPRRTWLNETFINAMPSTFNSLIKTVIKNNLSNHGSNPSLMETNDKAFLISYPEVFGIESYAYYGDHSKLEGEQYPYYVTKSNRTKYANNNGGKSNNQNYWWLRSPSLERSSSGFYWIYVNFAGAAGGFINYVSSCGFAPAFCL